MIMPLIDISITEGRTPEQLRGLIDGVHAVVERTVGASAENITVIVREVAAEHWSRANRTVAELRAENTSTST